MENLFSVNYIDLSSDARGYQALPEDKICLYKAIHSKNEKGRTDKTYYIRINRILSKRLVAKGFTSIKIGKVELTGEVLFVFSGEGSPMTIDKNGGCLRLNSKVAVHGLAELLGIEITEHMHKILDIIKVKSFDDKEIFKVS